MTLIVTINGPDTIWASCDRRLSVGRTALRDDAHKIMLLETPASFDAAPGTPGHSAILVYAGLGQTAAGVEPSNWMGRVLRGRGMPLEPSLGVLTDAIRQQLPAHLPQLAENGKGVSHSVIAPAIVGSEARLYTIDYVISPEGQRFWRYVRRVNGRGTTPRIAIAGSGAAYLAHEPRRWMRPLLHLVKVCDAGRIDPIAVADHLARLNNDVHQVDQFVGQRCIVSWRSRRGGAQNGGGGHQFYTGIARDPESPALASIAYGRDMQAFINVIAPPAFARLREMMEGRPDPGEDRSALEKALSALLEKPDEELR